MKAAKVLVCHTTPQRSRLVVAGQADRAASFATVSQALSACTEVEAVEVNPRTGSIVLRHRHGALSRVLAFLRQNLRQHHALDVHVEYDTRGESLARRYNRQLQHSLQSIDRSLRDFSAGELDLASLAGVCFATLAIYQLRRGIFLPAGLTLLVLAHRVANGKLLKTADAPTTS